MFDKIASWWRAKAEWRRAHVLAFARVSGVDSDGVTKFQQQLMAAVSDVIPESAFKREFVKGGIETYFVAVVPGTKTELFIYPLDAGISMPRKPGSSSIVYCPYEEWDYATPEELIAEVAMDVRNAA